MKKKMLIALSCLAMVMSMAACSTQTLPSTESQDTGEAISDVPTDAVGGYMPCPLNMIPNEESIFPYMGLSFRLPENLLTAVLNNKVFMCNNGEVEYTDIPDGMGVTANWKPTDENTVIHNGIIEFLYLPEGMRDRTPYMGMETPMNYEEYLAWIADALPMMRLTMFQKAEFQEVMLQNTGYANHVRLGENTEFVYYLSSNEPASNLTQDGKDLFAAQSDLKESVVISEPRPIDNFYLGLTTPQVEFASQVGNFQTETVYGEQIDQSIFSSAKLTMINAWTTWCGPCVEELPDLAELSAELEDTGVQIIAIACDTIDPKSGALDQEQLELAQKIVERTGVNFPVLVPDSILNDGLLKGIVGYPTTWFVDAEGKVIGDPVLGSNSKEDWMQMIQERLEEVGK